MPFTTLTAGFWWQSVSWKLDCPPWETNIFTLGWPRTSCCGSHLCNMTFSGFPSIVSVSHFHNTFCFRDPKTSNRVASLSAPISDAFNTDLEKTQCRVIKTTISKTVSSPKWHENNSFMCVVKEGLQIFVVKLWVGFATVHHSWEEKLLYKDLS